LTVSSVSDPCWPTCRPQSHNPRESQGVTALVAVRWLTRSKLLPKYTRLDDSQRGRGRTPGGWALNHSGHLGDFGVSQTQKLCRCLAVPAQSERRTAKV
jgi:hypothetical protein